MLYANRGRAPRIENLSEKEAEKKIRENNEDSMYSSGLEQSGVEDARR